MKNMQGDTMNEKQGRCDVVSCPSKGKDVLVHEVTNPVHCWLCDDCIDKLSRMWLVGKWPFHLLGEKSNRERAGDVIEYYLDHEPVAGLKSKDNARFIVWRLQEAGLLKEDGFP